MHNWTSQHMKLPQNHQCLNYHKTIYIYMNCMKLPKYQINMYSTTTNQLANPPKSWAQVLSPGVQRDPRGPHAESWAPRGR